MVIKIKEFIDELFIIDTWEVISSLDKETLKSKILEKFNYSIPSNNRWNIFQRDEVYMCTFEGDRFTIEIKNNKSNVGKCSIYTGELIEEGAISKIKMRCSIDYYLGFILVLGVCSMTVISILTNEYLNLIFMIGAMTIGILFMKIEFTNENQKFILFFNSKIPR